MIDLKKNWLQGKIFILILVPFFTIFLLMSIFGSVKSLLPLMNPFYLDEKFMEIDKMLHFGYHPFEITHMIFGNPFITRIIDICYQTWFFFLMGFTTWMVVSHQLGRLRAKFLLSYLFTWAIIGSLFAVMFSAAGPCYYSYFVEGTDIYSPLMQRLKEIGEIYKDTPEKLGLFSLNNQTRLWSYYTDDFIGLGSGISAMPSMHVSFAMLLFLTIRQMNKWLGYFALGFLIIIQIGSVHLGWHYAIDGYISIIATYFLWRIAGFIIKRYDNKKSQKLLQD